MIFLPFAVVFGTMFVLFILSRTKFQKLIEPIESDEYKLKFLLPIGLYLIEIMGCTFRTMYSMRLIIRCAELKDYKSSMFYVKILYADKIVLAMLMALLSSALLVVYGSFDEGLIIFAGIMIIIGFFAPDREILKKVKNRKLILRMEFPIFLNKLVLLINAGMTIGNAWERIAREDNSKSVFYDEVRQVVSRIKSGIPEISSYEEFARRCRIPEISKFASLLSQNIIRGGTELPKSLKYLSSECWEMRKFSAMRFGEEASTKMLFPMTLMFIAVIIIVVAPALIMLKG